MFLDMIYGDKDNEVGTSNYENLTHSLHIYPVA